MPAGTAACTTGLRVPDPSGHRCLRSLNGEFAKNAVRRCCHIGLWSRRIGVAGDAVAAAVAASGAGQVAVQQPGGRCGLSAGSQRLAGWSGSRAWRATPAPPPLSDTRVDRLAISAALRLRGVLRRHVPRGRFA